MFWFNETWLRIVYYEHTSLCVTEGLQSKWCELTSVKGVYEVGGGEYFSYTPYKVCL